MRLACSLSASPSAQQDVQREEFYWLGEINKASAVINAEQGLLEAAVAPRIARGLDSVLRAGDQPGGKRPTLVITFEPLLIQAAGVGSQIAACTVVPNYANGVAAQANSYGHYLLGHVLDWNATQNASARHSGGWIARLWELRF